MTTATEKSMLTDFTDYEVFTEAIEVAKAYTKKYGRLDAMERLRTRQLALASDAHRNLRSRFAFCVASDATNIIFREYAIFGE